MTITAARAVNIMAEVEAAAPPPPIKAAAARCVALAAAGHEIPRDLMDTVMRWCGSRCQQNRYGK